MRERLSMPAAAADPGGPWKRHRENEGAPAMPWRENASTTRLDRLITILTEKDQPACGSRRTRGNKGDGDTPTTSHRKFVGVHRDQPASRTMDAIYEQEPYSFRERVAGCVAMATVALVAFLAFRGISQTLNRNQPANDLRAMRLPETAQPEPSAKISQRHRHAPTRTVRAPGESPVPAAADGRPAPRPERPEEAVTPQIGEAASAAMTKLHAPVPSGPPVAVNGALDLFRLGNGIIAHAPEPAEDPLTPAPGATEKNPSSRSDSLWIQAKLREMGYYSGLINGIWGPASRGALRDFKTMNGLQDDDRWDRETERALSSGQGVRASGTFIGAWAKSVEACQAAPLVVRPHGASVDGGRCDFRSVRQETSTTWRIEAACSARERTWRANISLKLTASSTLSWTSERGNATYVRCSKPDVASARR